MRALKIVVMMSAAWVMRAQSATAESAKVSYADGQLKIEAFDSPLSDIFSKVSTLTGVKLDLPDGVKDRRIFTTLGPGPAGRILAALLADADVDYLIQESDTDKEKIQRVLLMAREKGPSGPPATQGAANNVRGPYARAAAAQPDNPAPAQSENTVVSAASSNSPPLPAQPNQSAPPSTQADATAQPSDLPAQVEAAQPSAPTQPLSQPGFLNGQRVAPVNPPVSLDSQTISQQLQQMYQQRMQLTQQDRQTSSPAPLPNSGGK